MGEILEQIIWLAVCIYHEARGEIAAGQIAVGHAILNRVEKRDQSVKEVVLAPWQFSWANVHIIEGKPLPPIRNYQAFIACMESAFICLGERLKGKDFFGADHYYNDALASPFWAKKMKFLARVGGHVFLKS